VLLDSFATRESRIVNTVKKCDIVKILRILESLSDDTLISSIKPALTGVSVYVFVLTK
jgi:hypothetical protein